MRSITSFAVLSSALARSFFATATIVTIRATAEAPFFDPTNATAEVGDILEFHFKAHNRSVVMGDYFAPCQPAASGGFYSGFFVEDDATTENATVFHVKVNTTDPIVYYCSQDAPEFGNHCKHGMAGVVNEPDLSAFQSYKDGAASVNTSITPDVAPGFGGVFADNPDKSAVSGTSTGSPSASTSTSAANGGHEVLNNGVGRFLSAALVAVLLAV